MPPKPQPAASSSVSKGFDPKDYVNKNQNVETITKLKEVFDLFDADHSGQISIPEIVYTIKALELESEAKNIITIVQASTTADELDFRTFVEIFGQPETQTEATLHELYEVFDPNHTNCFGPEDFERACALVG